MSKYKSEMGQVFADMPKGKDVWPSAEYQTWQAALEARIWDIISGVLPANYGMLANAINQKMFSAVVQFFRENPEPPCGTPVPRRLTVEYFIDGVNCTPEEYVAAGGALLNQVHDAAVSPATADATGIRGVGLIAADRLVTTDKSVEYPHRDSEEREG